MNGPLLLRRRPLVVEAWQVTPDNVPQVADWCDGTVAPGGGVAVRTDTGSWATAHPGDWMVRGPFGVFYPAADRVVFSSYERVLAAVAE